MTLRRINSLSMTLDVQVWLRIWEVDGMRRESGAQKETARFVYMLAVLAIGDKQLQTTSKRKVASLADMW